MGLGKNGLFPTLTGPGSKGPTGMMNMVMIPGGTAAGGREQVAQQVVSHVGFPALTSLKGRSIFLTSKLMSIALENNPRN